MICRCCHKTAPDGLYCVFCGRRQDVPRQAHKRGNGQGSAYRRGKTWTGVRAGYQYTDDDGLHRKRQTKGGFATKKEALEWASTKTALLDHSPKLIELWEMYERDDLPKLSKSRQTSYRAARKRLEPLMGMEIHLVTMQQLQGIISAAGTYNPAHDCQIVLSKLYKKALASNNGLVTKNLAEFLTLPKHDEKEAVPFSADEVKAFWELYDRNDYFVGYILLMCYSGMMPAELLSCKKSMVDLDACEIFGCGAKTKSRRMSAIVFPEILRPVVQALLNSKGEKLFASYDKNFYSEYYACLERAKVRKLPPYSCRHTFGTETIRLGLHPAVVQKLLRHSNTKMQEKYTHLSSEDAHNALKGVSRG